MPYFGCMKMTMHVDEALLKRVMAAAGTTNKTQAVDLALREMSRRHELKRLAEAGLGLEPDELRDAFDPSTPTDNDVPPVKTAYATRKPRSR